MNTFVLVLTVPTLLTIVSASTLYFSFKGRVDTSGRYFLLAEFLWLVTLFIVIAMNLQPSLVSTLSFFAISVATLFSEVTILLSIEALTKKIPIRKFIYWIIFVISYCGFIEYCRYAISPLIPLLFFSIFSLCVTSFTYITCKRINSDGLENNLFIQWIAYTEIALLAIHILRFTSYFTDSPMKAINPQPLATIFFSIWLSVNLVRYFSYLALRVSWVDPRASNDNALNKSLVKLANEKEQFLQGLMSSNRALGISALANSLAHQLSQPITGISLQTESVKRELLNQGNQEKLVQILDTVTEQLSKISALVTNLRRLFGTKESEFKPFNLQTACNEVLEIIKPTLYSKNIALTKYYADSLIVIGNPIQIQQVLINLFNNAVDAIDAVENTKSQDRKIDLIISQDQSFAVIAIKDTGGGISPKIESSVFELYQSTKSDGLGIGLWLCKIIIDKHHGSLTASNQLAGGAVFEIRLPLAN